MMPCFKILNPTREVRPCLAGKVHAGTLLLALMLCGCSSRLARENVFANTESVYGLAVGQNTKTQAPEIRLGYVRHEFFYVPTSKTLLYTNSGKGLGMERPIGDQPTNFHNPSLTPEVLAEIAIGSGGGIKLGDQNQASARFKVRQRLAVGREAVKAPAAGILMGDSPDPQILAAAKAYWQQVATDAQKVADYVAPNGTVDKERLDKVTKGTPLEGKLGAHVGQSKAEFHKALEDKYDSFLTALAANAKD